MRTGLFATIHLVLDGDRLNQSGEPEDWLSETMRPLMQKYDGMDLIDWQYAGGGDWAEVNVPDTYDPDSSPFPIPESAPKISSGDRLRDFHNRMRILTGIDMHELVDAGVIQEHDRKEWEAFRDDPWRWFIKAPDAQSDLLWSIIERRARR